jgi:hypothetical protein
MLNFSTKRGDTFDEVLFELKKDGVAINLTGATIHMQLRKAAGGPVFLNLISTASAGITITDAVAGKFKINTTIINLEANVYLYDIEITFSTGEVRTWVSGQFTVLNDITR